MRGRAVVARRAHNPEVLGSNPSPATIQKVTQTSDLFFGKYPTRVSNLILLGGFAQPRYKPEGHSSK